MYDRISCAIALVTCTLVMLQGTGSDGLVTATEGRASQTTQSMKWSSNGTHSCVNDKAEAKAAGAHLLRIHTVRSILEARHQLALQAEGHQ